MSEGTRRLFIALWPGEALRNELVQATHEHAVASGGRVVPAANLHITLAFLGSVVDSRVETIERCMDDVKIEPFEILFGEIVWWKRQALLCLEPTAGDERLQMLVDRLRRSLADRGFEVESRPFRPHVTLAREVEREWLRVPIKTVRWTADRVVLIESTLTEKGSRYAVVPVGGS
jgi:2'-5' RNA ligase